MVAEGDVYELFQRGSQLLADHHPHQAATVLERARQLEPDKASIAEALARAYYEAGQRDAAEATFAEALELDPTNDYAHFGLALCLVKAGFRARAIGHLRMALVMRPGMPDYQRALARAERAR